MRNWIALFESTSEPTLRFDNDEDCWVFEGYSVLANLLGDPEYTLCVQEFSSRVGGQGNGEKAMRWLKANCPIVGASDPGEPGTQSFAFWENMANKGLVDFMTDREDGIIFKDGEWFDTFYWSRTGDFKKD